MNVIRDVALDGFLLGLHADSDAQDATLKAFAAQAEPPSDEELKAFRSDKFVALDRDKACFCHQLCRAIDARRIVEVGTSFGVSTLYLAAAVRDNVRQGGHGVVIGTEYEPRKAEAARENFRKAGLAEFIELREGDLRETLRNVEAPVDLVLMDIWIRMARPALELVAPRLRPGAVVLCDNTAIYREDYADYFAFIEDPANGFTTMTLPFAGGLELSVRGIA
jgi:predicted O-methyltransferase YrrM